MSYPAQAARPLTKAEKRGISRALDGFLPPKCIKGKRSTINLRYALARNKNASCAGEWPANSGVLAYELDGALALVGLGLLA